MEIIEILRILMCCTSSSTIGTVSYNNYPNSDNRKWVIEAEVGQQIKVKFTNLTVEWNGPISDPFITPSCRDVVAISTDGQRHDPICGSSTVKKLKCTNVPSNFHILF